MPLPMQGKILRAIEERVVTPVGGKPNRFEARVIAATHRDLPRARRAKAHSVKTSTTVSTWFRSCCRPYASGAKTSCQSPRNFCSAKRGKAGSSALPLRPRGSFRNIPGREMCANYAT